MHTHSETIKEIPVEVEKIVPLIYQIPKIFESEKGVVVTTPGKNEIVEVVKPVIYKINQYIDKIVQKLVEVPILLKEASPVEMVQEQIVPGPGTHTVKEVPREITVQKEIYQEVEKKVVEQVNRIDEVLKVAVDVIEKDRPPVIITNDRIV